LLYVVLIDGFYRMSTGHSPLNILRQFAVARVKCRLLLLKPQSKKIEAFFTYISSRQDDFFVYSSFNLLKTYALVGGVASFFLLLICFTSLNTKRLQQNKSYSETHDLVVRFNLL
jgi:hypothetical protein